MSKQGQRTEHVPATTALEKGIRILGIEYGLTSSSGCMLDNPEYFAPGEIYSQLTNWGSIERIDYGPGMQAYLHLEDVAGVLPSIHVSKHTLKIKGDLMRLEKEIQDRRWAILGNQGIWFRFALATQERHGIFAFHAASLYNPESNHLVILAGKAGAGKTVYLLSSISTGWRIFSTEMTYFSLNDSGLSFYRGSLLDNIFVGSFTVDFPEAISHLEVEIPVVQDPWAHKVCVDMHAVAVDLPVLLNPAVSFSSRMSNEALIVQKCATSRMYVSSGDGYLKMPVRRSGLVFSCMNNFQRPVLTARS